MPDSALRSAQLTMAAHLRDPDQAPAPVVEERRLQIYRDLIYNNIENFISSGFPVLRSLYEDADWHALVRAFIRDHRCHTPLFYEISQEFLAFLMEEHEQRPCDPAFLTELAHYEWVELALDIADDAVVPDTVDAGADLLAGIPVVSPVAWSLAYRFPVHHIGPDNRPLAAPDAPTYLVVYRDRDDSVRFMESNAATARLLELLRDNDSNSGATVLGQLAGELGLPQDTVLDFGTELLDTLRRQSVLLGARRSSASG